jgi:type VI secretion system protein ImpC
MRSTSASGEVNLDVRAARTKTGDAADSGDPFRILILGDFSGRARRGESATGAKLAARKPALVDRDNFDDVLAKFGVELVLPLGDTGQTLRFADLDDFHPDRIFERVALFQRLREARQRLSDPTTFAAVAAELGITRGGEASVRPSEPPARSEAPLPDVSQMASRSLLEDAIGATEGRVRGDPPVRRPDDLAAFIQRAVAPHVVARANPRQAELLGVADQATSAQMRALLHLPDFKALEAAWRAVSFVVRRVETDASLKLYLLDISKAELAADQASADDLTPTGTYKLLVEQAVKTPGAEPWAVIAGNFTFERTPDDIRLLSRLAKIAAAAGAPFIADAKPEFLGCAFAQDLQEPGTWKDLSGSGETRAWEALRRLPEASYLGLALPRFLLRLPYGKETDAVQHFAFEEMIEPPAHDDYLWGSPALLCVCLLAQSFAEDRWAMTPDSSLEIDGLPLHVYEENGESVAQPCAETLMSENAAMRILEAGLMPVASLKHTDAVRLVRFQSIANPLRGLSGRWG